MWEINWSFMVQLVSGSYDWSFVLSSWASLFSSTAGVSSTSITVYHLYGLVARFFQTWKTEVKHWRGSLGVEAMKHSWSLGVSPSWMLICFHFAGTLLATSFIRSDNSGSLSSPAYLILKSASKETADRVHYTSLLNWRGDHLKSHNERSSQETY